MREAATFTLGRSGDKRAVAAAAQGARRSPRRRCRRSRASGSRRSTIRASAPALIGGARRRAQATTPRAPRARTRSARAGSTAGSLPLLAALDDNRGEAQRLAAWALGQHRRRKALGPLIRAYFAAPAAARRRARVGDRPRQTAPAGRAPAATPPSIPMRSDKYDDRTRCAACPARCRDRRPAPRLVVDHADDIAKALDAALGEHRDVVVSRARAISTARRRSSALGALSPAAAGAATSVAADRSRRSPPSARRWPATVVAPCQRDRDPKVRALAVVGASPSSTPRAETRRCQRLDDEPVHGPRSAMRVDAVLPSGAGGRGRRAARRRPSAPAARPARRSRARPRRRKPLGRLGGLRPTPTRADRRARRRATASSAKPWRSRSASRRRTEAVEALDRRQPRPTSRRGAAAAARRARSSAWLRPSGAVSLRSLTPTFRNGVRLHRRDGRGPGLRRVQRVDPDRSAAMCVALREWMSARSRSTRRLQPMAAPACHRAARRCDGRRASATRPRLQHRAPSRVSPERGCAVPASDTASATPAARADARRPSSRLRVARVRRQAK